MGWRRQELRHVLSTTALVETTVLIDERYGFRLSVTTVPGDAQPGLPPSDVGEVAYDLGVTVQRRLHRVDDARLCAATAAMLLDHRTAVVGACMDSMLAMDRRDPLRELEGSLRAFIEDSICYEAVRNLGGVRVGSLLSDGGEDVCLCSVASGEGTVMATVVDIGTVVVVAPGGPYASAVLAQVAQWVTRQGVPRTAASPWLRHASV